MALVMAMLIGGVAALTGTPLRGTRTEGGLYIANGMALSVPDFLWGLILILLFGVLAPIFHISGRITPSLELPFVTNFYLFESLLRLRFDLWADIVSHMFLPALALEMNQYPTTETEFRENLLRGIYVPMGGDALGRQPGEALWPERSPVEKILRTKANMLDYDFEALFQQMPRMAVGEFFDDVDFKIEERAPEGLQWFRYVDLALGESKTADRNSTIAVALDEKTGDLWLRDRIKERTLDAFLGMIRAAMLSDEEHGVEWGIEDVAFQQLVVRQFMRDAALVKVRIQGIKPLGDKVERARAWQLRAKQGRVKLVRGAWNLDFIREATSFPKGRHDDDVDTVSGGVQMIADGAGGTMTTASERAVVVEAESLF